MEENIKWKSIELINIKEYIKDEYIQFLYECYQDYKTRNLFTNDMYVKSEKDFVKELQTKMMYKYHEFVIIKSTVSNELVGFIYSYEYRANDGNLHITTYIKPDKRNSVFGVQACLEFYDYLFNKYSIRKVYCTAFSYNKASISVLESAKFKLEGCLKEYKYFNNQYYDMYIYALYRDDFNKLKIRLKR